MKNANVGASSRKQFLRFTGATVASGLAACSGGPSTIPSAPPPTAGLTDLTRSIVSVGPSVPVAVTVTRTTGIGYVRGGLAGLSYEKEKMSFSFFSPANANLIGCFKRLGPSVLRIGGISVESSHWLPAGAGGAFAKVAPPDVDRLAGFLQSTSWRVIYGINLATNTPAAAAAEAAYVAKALGAHLLGFEIGNEVDHYSRNGLRPTTYTLTDFLNEWATYAAAIRQAVPNAPLTGPATSAATAWSTAFAAAQRGNVKILTQHHYRGDGRAASATMTELLNGDPYLLPVLSELRTAAVANSIVGGVRLAEANSYYYGGAPGVSNAYGSALWAVDYLMTVAQAGAAGVNFHGGGIGPSNAVYTPIHDTSGTIDAVMPIYYGMLLVSQIETGPTYAVAVNSPIGFSAYAVGGTDGATYVVLINKDATTVAKTTVDPGGAATYMTTLALTGAGLGALTGTTLGTAPVAANGGWLPTTLNAGALPARGTGIAISVAPASAVLLKLT